MKRLLTSLIVFFLVNPTSLQERQRQGIVPLSDTLYYLISPFIQRIDFTGDEVCEPEIGCFRRDDVGYVNAIHRPVNVLPQSRKVINTRFLLYTRETADHPQEIIPNNLLSLSASNFLRRRPTKILIHGYLYRHLVGKYQQDAFNRLIKALLTAGDYNVILADWGDGATTWYFQASANSRVVGAEIALLLTFLHERAKVSMEDFHLIGHSLGAHIAGLAGQRVRNVGRITGLDPAKPYFEATHPDIRLDPLDAVYVDVLHTDASLNGNDMFSLGTRQLMGDVDFFPNNGDRQPRCTDEVMSRLFDGRSGLIGAARHMMTCDHRRSVDLLSNYLEESRSRRCIPLAYKCPSWRAYESGQCWSCGARGENCAIVGEPKVISFKSKTEFKTPYYIKTSVKSPLCAFQYRVEFSFSRDLRRTSLMIEVADANGVRTSERTRESDWMSGRTYAFVVASGRRMITIDRVTISSDTFMVQVGGLPGVRVLHATVTPLNEWSDQRKVRMSTRFCNFVDQGTRRGHSC